MRGEGSSDHVFLYRNRAMHKDLVSSRIRDAGLAVGVKVYPHRLRHTCATQLLNAGCKVTSIQKFLGHKKLNTTMIYARAHDQTVSDDYYSAMGRVEQRLQVGPEPKSAEVPISEEEKAKILLLVEQMASPEASQEERLSLFEQIRGLLFGCPPVQMLVRVDENAWIPPPGGLALAD